MCNITTTDAISNLVGRDNLANLIAVELWAITIIPNRPGQSLGYAVMYCSSKEVAKREIDSLMGQFDDNYEISESKKMVAVTPNDFERLKSGDTDITVVPMVDTSICS